MEMFQGYEHEVTLLLITLREYHSPQAVELVGGAILEAAKSEKMKPKHDNLTLDAAKDESTDKQCPTLEELLATPLNIPDAALSPDSHVTYQKEIQPEGVFPLLWDFLSTNSSEELESFKDCFLRRLLLINPQIVTHILPHRPDLFSRPVKEGSSCVGLLASCLGDGLVLNVSEDMKAQLAGIWRRVGVADEDFSCSVKVFSTMLWHLFRNNEDASALVQLLFDLLSEAISKLSESSGGKKVPPILSELIESHLFKDAFLPEKLFKVPKTKRKMSKYSLVELFSHQIGQLLSTSLQNFPDLSLSSGVQSAKDKLLAAISEYVKNPIAAVGDLLSRLLCDLQVAISSDVASKFCQSLLCSHVHKESVSFVASVLTLLVVSETTPSDCMRSVLVSSQEVGGVCISESALEGLVQLAVKSKGGTLDKLVCLVLKRQFSQLGDSVKAFDRYSSLATEAHQSRCADYLTSGIDSALASLLSLRISESVVHESHTAALKSDLSVSQLLTSPSDIFLTDKLDKIYSTLISNCAHNPRACKVLEASNLHPSPPSLPHSCESCHLSEKTVKKLLEHCTNHTPLSEEVVKELMKCGDIIHMPLSDRTIKKLLKHCVHRTSRVSADITSLLFSFSDFSLSYFSTSLLCELCDRLALGVTESVDRGGVCSEEERVWVLCVLLSYLEHSGGDSESFKMAAKTLWHVCSSLITSSDCKETQNICSKLLHIIYQRISKVQKKIGKLLLKWNKSSEDWSYSQLSLALSLPLDLSSLPAIVMEHAFHMLSKLFLTDEREGGSEEEERLLEKLIEFTKGSCQSSCENGLATEVVSQFIYTTLKYRFSSPPALTLLVQFVGLLHKYSSEQNEDVFDVSLMYERVWSHSKFLPVMCQSHDQENSGQLSMCLKECLIELLVTLVEWRPSLGNSSHVPLLLGAYSATRSKSDRGILYLLFKYEEAGVSLEKHRPLLWGPAAIEHYRQKQEVGWLLWKQPGMQEVVGQLKREVMNESIRNFPLEANLNPTNAYSSGCGHEERPVLYDPCFLLPLLTQQLDPGNLIDCRRFIDSGCLGYLIASLSSTVTSVRSMGGRGLELFVNHLEGSRFREKSQVSLLLEVLKNSLSEKDMRLPSIFSAFFSTTSSLLLHAESPLYPVVTHFLVYKPALDLGEVPLFMTMLQSSSVEHKEERVWILQLLVNGLRCKEDYSLYRKKRVFDHCLSLLATGIAGKRCQTLILELVLRGVSIPEVAVDLVVNKGLITSLEIIKTITSST